MGAIDSWGMQFNNSSGLVSSSGPGVESEDSASNSMTYGDNNDDPGTWTAAEGEHHYPQPFRCLLAFSAA